MCITSARRYRRKLGTSPRVVLYGMCCIELNCIIVLLLYVLLSLCKLRRFIESSRTRGLGTKKSRPLALERLVCSVYMIVLSACNSHTPPSTTCHAILRYCCIQRAAYRRPREINATFKQRAPYVYDGTGHVPSRTDVPLLAYSSVHTAAGGSIQSPQQVFYSRLLSPPNCTVLS